MNLIIKDTDIGEEEKITRKIKIKDEMIEKTEIISQKIEENLLEFGNYLIKGKDNLLLKIRHSLATLVGGITVNFDEASGDIDLSEMIFDADLNQKKSILYMSNWPKVVDQNKILFISK